MEVQEVESAYSFRLFTFMFVCIYLCLICLQWIINLYPQENNLHDKTLVHYSSFKCSVIDTSVRNAC